MPKAYEGAWWEWLLRPPGAGIPTVSTGDAATLRLQQKHFAAVFGAKAYKRKQKFDADAARSAWLRSLGVGSDSAQLGLKRARVALLGVPLDTGAGIRRGAAGGPRGVREALLESPQYRRWLNQGVILDLGDLFVNPHLLHDEMLNEGQIRLCQDGMYPEVPEPLRRGLPVSALSQARWVLSRLLRDYPNLKIFVIGGDHSVAWPVTEAFCERYPGTLGIVQPDAHTDLLASRLGVRYCFGTWSYHAREKLGDPGRLVQIGIRQSRRDRGHWELNLGVRQIWASEIRARVRKAGGNARIVAEKVAQEITTQLKEHGVQKLYFSNDIDGTDEREALATGTPAPDGLTSSLLIKVIQKLARKFDWVAADIMEVAPDLGPTPAVRHKTCRLAARYTVECLRALLEQPL